MKRLICLLALVIVLLPLTAHALTVNDSHQCTYITDLDSDWLWTDNWVGPNPRKIYSIQFVPSAMGDRCVMRVNNRTTGPIIFDFTCVDVSHSPIKYFGGEKLGLFFDYSESVIAAPDAAIIIHLYTR